VSKIIFLAGFTVSLDVHNFISFPGNVLSGSDIPEKEDPFSVQLIQTSFWLPA